MSEWVVLILVIPAVVVPFVLLFGFAGCDLVFKLEPVEPPPPVFQTAFLIPLGGEDGRDNRCIVQRIEPDILLASGPRVRITLQRPKDGPVVIESLYISQAAGETDPNADPYDSAADLTAVVQGGAPITLLPDAVEPTFRLPVVEYAFDHTKALLIAFDIGADGRVPHTTVPTGMFARAFVGPLENPPLHEASLANRRSTGYTVESRVYFVKEIETEEV
jgi:hypothetical protein